MAGDRELVITRTFEAPRETVFEAWTRAEHLVRWWGPKYFTLPFCEIDFRERGSYRFCMRSPDGENHWVWGEYREILRPERIVMTWNRENAAGELWSSTIVTLSFADNAGNTAFTLHQELFETVAYRDQHEFGWGQCLDRLAAYSTQTFFGGQS
jgi:uncharacterized protein YndB with AHSA1/START domain